MAQSSSDRYKTTTRRVLERCVLAVSFYSTSDQSSWNFRFSTSDDVCGRNIDVNAGNGVYCEEEEGSVAFLQFSELRMNGSLPWELVLLTDLKHIIFEQNALTGSIPSRIGEFIEVETVKLNTKSSRRDIARILSPRHYSCVIGFQWFQW